MHKISEHIKQNWSFLDQKDVYVACSGGIDSMVLLHVFHDLGYRPTALHVNYQLRARESEEDQNFVERFCEERKIPIKIRRFDTPQLLEDGGNLQNMARTLRYNWFNEILNRSSDRVIALGHHLDDQVETFFLQLARDSGVMGLAAMLEVKGKFIRPLLAFTREEIKEYALKNNVEWREDSSNLSAKYSRNNLRNFFLPEIYKDIPELKEDVALLIKQFQYKQKELEESVTDMVQKIKESKFIDTKDYQHLDTFEKIEVLRQLNIPPSMMDEFDKLLRSGKGKFIDLPGALFDRVYRETKGFSFMKIEESVLPELKVEKISVLPEKFSKDILYLDETKVQGKLKLRRWKVGDRISPVGMTGSQLISDVINDAKIKTVDKSGILILHDDKTIHWCVGLKIARHAIATRESKQILKCSIETKVSKQAE